MQTRRVIHVVTHTINPVALPWSYRGGRRDPNDGTAGSGGQTRGVGVTKNKLTVSGFVLVLWGGC